MTVIAAVMAIVRYNQIIRDCERRLDGMHSAFLHDHRDIEKTEHRQHRAIVRRDMLIDWLTGIGGDDG